MVPETLTVTNCTPGSRVGGVTLLLSAIADTVRMRTGAGDPPEVTMSMLTIR